MQLTFDGPLADLERPSLRFVDGRAARVLKARFGSHRKRTTDALVQALTVDAAKADRVVADSVFLAATLDRGMLFAVLRHAEGIDDTFIGHRSFPPPPGSVVRSARLDRLRFGQLS